MRYRTCFKRTCVLNQTLFLRLKFKYIAVQTIIRRDTVDSVLQNKMSHLPKAVSVKIKRILQNNRVKLQILKDVINTSDLNSFLHQSAEHNQAHESI